jgi:uncharacterized cupin superfamily protein
MSNTNAIDLEKCPIHIPDGVGQPTVPIPGSGYDGPSFEAYVEAHCTNDAPGRLMMIETTPGDWPMWECHTDGDEIVFILEGAGDFIQDIDRTEVRTPIAAGVTLINRKDVWHTADVTSPMRAIYLTPCPGTEHKSH